MWALLTLALCLYAVNAMEYGGYAKPGCYCPSTPVAPAPRYDPSVFQPRPPFPRGSLPPRENSGKPIGPSCVEMACSQVNGWESGHEKFYQYDSNSEVQVE